MDLLIETVENLDSPNILLAGDLMLDEFIYGDAERISPESPVPVLRVVREESRLGGAANVAIAAAALGANIKIIGTVGNDDKAEKVIELLGAIDVDCGGIVKIPGRPTTAKIRCVGLAQHRHAQQMLRIDHETTEPLPLNVRDEIIEKIMANLDKTDIFAIEDYAKGLFDDETTPRMIQAAREKDIPVIVDPHPSVNYKRYYGTTIITPNRTEASIASGVNIVDDNSALLAANEILRITNCNAVVITLDKEGAFIRTREGLTMKIPTRPRTVYDVTGAGDVVMATLSIAIASGCTLPRAVALCNIAGGLEVERFGVTPVTREELIHEIRNISGLGRQKIFSRDDLKAELDRRRRDGDTVVFTNGCFDLMHTGHLAYLREAKRLGACLVVAINTDASVAKLKGPDRPIVSEKDRAEMLAGLECVDYVTIFNEDTPEALLAMLKPDILVKGGSTGEIVGHKLVESYGGTVKKLSLVEGMSTTDIIQKINKTGKKR